MNTLFRQIALLMLLTALAACAAGEEAPGPAYVENEWDYAEGSIDASHGIPEDAVGQLLKIREAGVLRVATEPYFAPQEFIDPELEGQDAYVGADMEMARLIAQRMGVELEIVPMEFTEVLPAVAEGHCDVAISALSYTPQRAFMVTMTKGYHYAGEDTASGLIVRASDDRAIEDAQSLENMDLVAQSGSLQEALLANYAIRYREFRRVASTQEVYRAVETGAADAGAVNLETATIYIENRPDCGLRLAEGIRFEMEPQFDGDRVAVKKGELQLAFFINGIIDELNASGQYEQWFEAYSARAAALGL